MSKGGKGGTKDPTLKGRTNEDVAKEVGLGSRKTYERAKKVWEKAKNRMKDGKKIDPKEIFPEREKGQTRDKVAEEVGIGSGRQYDKAKKVWKKAGVKRRKLCVVYCLSGNLVSNRKTRYTPHRGGGT